METLFDYKKRSPNNCLSFFTRFSELELSTYINEFELMIQVYGEKSVNIDCQRYVLRLTDFIKIFNILIDIIRRSINYQMMGFYNST